MERGITQYLKYNHLFFSDRIDNLIFITNQLLNDLL